MTVTGAPVTVTGRAREHRPVTVAPVRPQLPLAARSASGVPGWPARDGTGSAPAWPACAPG
ncbi:hypothetical protein OWR29_39060 [Actinoplanes sp. Pm04-4]|uniref:Uncharacterized protein n=1 Tax=Paractinoplanes pyxinae TaxID=2997416 RepID=A0ABT4BC24_9ACTN|nr:hypothetical protein [Actinoplanes pyxinae]MCY1144031.1 hypothetical protein [Actinoplanes pyxinae]